MMYVEYENSTLPLCAADVVSVPNIFVYDMMAE